MGATYMFVFCLFQLLLVNVTSNLLETPVNQSSLATNEDLLRILANHSTSRYFIIYRQHYTNHMTHGLVALQRLGATNERLVRFTDLYAPRLFTPNNQLNLGTGRVTDGNIREFRGKTQNFYGLLQYITGLLDERYNGSVDAFVQGEFPKVMTSLGASVLHPMIQTGYALAGRSVRAVSEGLAYLWFAYLPLSPKAMTLNFDLGGGNMTFPEILRDLRQDISFRQRVATKAQNYTTGGNYFKRSMAVMLLEEADTLIRYVQKLKFPAELAWSTDDAKWSHQVPRWMMENALLIYTTTSIRNNFFLLHGVTGAWAIRQIIPALRLEDQETTAKVFSTVLLALYVSQGAPEVIGLPPRETYQYVTWDTAVRRTMTDDFSSHGVHVIKLIQVVKELDESRNIREQAVEQTTGDDLHSMCLAAAASVLNNGFVFEGEPA